MGEEKKKTTARDGQQKQWVLEIRSGVDGLRLGVVLIECRAEGTRSTGAGILLGSRRTTGCVGEIVVILVGGVFLPTPDAPGDDSQPSQQSGATNPDDDADDDVLLPRVQTGLARVIAVGTQRWCGPDGGDRNQGVRRQHLRYGAASALSDDGRHHLSGLARDERLRRESLRGRGIRRGCRFRRGCCQSIFRVR